MAQKDIKLSDVTQSLAGIQRGLKKHANLIFISAVLGAVIYSVITVNSILNSPSDESYLNSKKGELTSNQFDATTIKKIETLGERDNPPKPTLPEGRINPFVE